MTNKFLRAALAVSLLGWVAPAWSQPGQDFPEGPGKDKVVAVCNGCHDINRLKAGYNAAGWNMLQHMMQNMGAPIEPEDWPIVTSYLMKTFPERPRPAAKQISGPVQATIKLWDVAKGVNMATLPWQESGVLNGLHGIAFSPTGRILAACGNSKIRLWDVPATKR